MGGGGGALARATPIPGGACPPPGAPAPGIALYTAPMPGGGAGYLTRVPAAPISTGLGVMYLPAPVCPPMYTPMYPPPAPVAPARAQATAPAPQFETAPPTPPMIGWAALRWRPVSNERSPASPSRFTSPPQPPTLPPPPPPPAPARSPSTPTRDRFTSPYEVCIVSGSGGAPCLTPPPTPLMGCVSPGWRALFDERPPPGPPSNAKCSPPLPLPMSPSPRSSHPRLRPALSGSGNRGATPPLDAPPGPSSHIDFRRGPPCPAPGPDPRPCPVSCPGAGPGTGPGAGTWILDKVEPDAPSPTPHPGAPAPAATLLLSARPPGPMPHLEPLSGGRPLPGASRSRSRSVPPRPPAPPLACAAAAAIMSANDPLPPTPPPAPPLPREGALPGSPPAPTTSPPGPAPHALPDLGSRV